MKTTFTPEEQEVLNIILDPLDNSDSTEADAFRLPDIDIEETCPDDLVPDILGEIRGRIEKYKIVLEDYVAQARLNRTKESVGEDDYEPCKEYIRMQTQLDHILTEISSSDATQLTT